MAAHKGNKYALGNDGGRPPIYDSPEKLQENIDKYFDSFADKDEYPTSSGLALALGFNSRSTMYEYAKKDEFSNIIKKALLRVEAGYEKMLQKPGCTGAIFALKNVSDWKDRQDITSGDKPVNPVQIHIDNSDAKL